MTMILGVKKLGGWLLANCAFVLGDLLLVGFGGWVLWHGNVSEQAWLIGISGGAILAGAVLLILPCVMDYRLRIKEWDAEIIRGGLEPLRNLEELATRVAHATSQWQMVQETADTTVRTITGVADMMASEAKRFTEFQQSANETEKQHLRLEAEKLRRAEADWLQVLVTILDHVYALHQAGTQSGQPALIEELNRFQNACRDVARRVGLAPLTASPGDRFNADLHQTSNPQEQPEPEALLSRIIANGYSFQGQLIRRALVVINPSREIPSSNVPTTAVTKPATDESSDTEATLSTNHPTNTLEDSQSPPAEPSLF